MRKRGQGSISKRNDGRWEINLRFQGTRYRLYAKTKAEAEAKLRQLRNQVFHTLTPEDSSPEPEDIEPSSKKSTKTTPGRTVSDLIDLWLSSAGFKPGTVQGYKFVINAHVIPTIGNIKLKDLSPIHIQGLLNQLQGKPSVADKAYRVLHRCFTVGVLWGELDENPCDRVMKPKYQTPVKSVWTKEQLQMFLNNTRGHWLYPLWLLTASTGCRLGELLALRWSDVDFKSGRITISRTVTWIKGEPLFSPPKTQAGIRVLQLPESVLKVLEELRERNQDSELVFVGPKAGRPLHPAVVQHNLRRLCKQLNLPGMTPHGLRHLHASLLLSNHIPVPLVSKQLGHANPGITMKIYAHAIDPGSEVARAIEAVINGEEK